MTPNVTPDGKPVCKRGETSLIAGSDQLFGVDSAIVSATGRKKLTEFFSKQTQLSRATLTRTVATLIT